MANIAIKGHETRGKEVIEILEMLGGNVDKKILSTANIGDILNPHVYFFDPDSSDNRIVWYYLLGIEADGRASEMMIFTLEEFEQKFPYKVGDKVKYINNIFCIKSAQWDNEKNTVIYYIDADWSAGYVVETNDLQPYKEQEIMKEKKTPKTYEEVNRYLLENPIKNAQNLLDIEKCLENDGMKLPENITIHSKGIGSIDFIKWYEKSKYPMTLNECYNVLRIPGGERYVEVDNPVFTNEIIGAFVELLICRYTYCKIAGEQMGLGKPWEPDFANCTIPHYCIFINHTGDVVKECFYGSRCVFAFPTEEMRDTFYENFKDLIEQCKELL